MKWFTLENEIVEGPYSTDELKEYAESNRLSSEALVWGRVQTSWVPVEKWAHDVDDMLASSNIYTIGTGREWHYGIGGESFGPFSRPDLIQVLMDLESLDDVLLWTTGMKDWTSVFEFHDVLDEMGINMRRHKRAEIEGSVMLTLDNGDFTTGKLMTISEGGLGFVGISDLTPGETVFIEIVSPAFKRHIRASAEVRYVSESNFVGVRFDKIHSEAIAQIIGYIRQSDNRRAPFYTKKSA